MDKVETFWSCFLNNVSQARYLLSTIYYLVHSYDISGLTCEHSPARHQSAVLRTLTGGWSPGNLAANLTADLTGPPQPHAGLLTITSPHGEPRCWAGRLSLCCIQFITAPSERWLRRCGGRSSGAAASNTVVLYTINRWSCTITEKAPTRFHI